MTVPYGYETLLASDVLEPNGLGLELYEPGGRLLMEVFRDDDADRALSLTVHEIASLPLSVVEWFLASARERLSS